MLVEILDERARERRMRAGITVSGEISRQRGIGDEQRVPVPILSPHPDAWSLAVVGLATMTG